MTRLNLYPPPSLFESKLYESTSWKGVVWPRRPGDGRIAKTFVRRYERLCLLTQNADRPEYFHQFYTLKMRAKRINEPFWSALVNCSYDWICEYGFNLEKAFFWWVGQIILGAVAIYVSVVRKARDYHGLRESDLFSEINDIALSLLYSMSNSVPLFNRSGVGKDFEYYRDVKRVGASAMNNFQVIGYIQIVFGTVFLFFLLLTLRNKFKMK